MANNKKYFEKYVATYTKVYANEIKRYPVKEYQRIMLYLEAIPDRHRLGLSVKQDSNDWEGIYHEEEMEDLNSYLSEAGFDEDFPWLMEIYIEEDDEIYEGEEEVVLNNDFFNYFIHWHCLAKIAFNLLSDPNLKPHLAKISKIEIMVGHDTNPKYVRVIPELADRERIINAVSDVSQTVQLLLDGWGDTYEGKYLTPLLEKLYEPRKI